MREINFYIFLLFAFIAAWQDVRYRSVPVSLFMVFAFIALALGIAQNNLPACLYGSLTGLVLLIISHLTRQAIGSGDAWFFIVAGLMLPFELIFLIFALSVFLSGIISLIVFVKGRIKDKRSAGKDTLPFLLFTAAAGVLLFAAGF